jgi:phosphohistidine phosphatase
MSSMTDEPGMAEGPATDPPATEDAAAAEDDAAPAGRRLQLYLLRHADAGDPAAWRGPDAERPLSRQGRRQATWVGRWLKAQGRLPDIVITSPKVRAAETAALVSADWDRSPIVDDRLAAVAQVDDVAAMVRDHAVDAKRVLLVGHDPDFSDVASDLIGARITLKKGALARIDLEQGVSAGSGVLRWLVPAEALAEDL